MTLRHTMELAGARVALAVIPRLPRPAVMGLARGAGWLAYRLCRHLRKVGQANLDLAYGASLTPAEKTGILKQAFVNFALVMLDVFWFARDAAARLEKYVHFHPSYYEHLFQDKAYVCIAAHIGNWEILGKAVSQHGYPLTSVAAPLDNRVLDDLFTGIRVNTGQIIISKHSALRKMIKTLADKGRVGLLLDQNTRLKEGGMFVPFFGRPVLASSAAAALALHSRSALGYGAVVARPDGHYEGVPVKHIPYDPETDTKETLTARILATIQQDITEHPGAWMWMYKRWKYVPEGANPADFPFYSKPAY